MTSKSRETSFRSILNCNMVFEKGTCHDRCVHVPYANSPKDDQTNHSRGMQFPLALWSLNEIPPFCRYHLQIHILGIKSLPLIILWPKSVPMGLFDNKSTLVHVLDWNWGGGNLFLKPINGRPKGASPSPRPQRDKSEMHVKIRQWNESPFVIRVYVYSLSQW